MSETRPAGEPEGIGRIREWLSARRPDRGKIDPDLDLIETRLIDSLQFVEFLLLLEELTGSEIDVAEVTADSFRTLRIIEQGFFQTPPRTRASSLDT